MKRIRIGTRSSPLALEQVNQCVDRIKSFISDIEAIIVPISTKGDKVKGPLCEVGGKGLFSKELHEQLLSGAIDIAVHSLKDLETTSHPGPAHSCVQYPGVQIIAVWGDEGSQDVLVSKVPSPKTIATSSARRADQWCMRHPETLCMPIRGNIQTRLQKLKESTTVDGIILAEAGLKRCGLWQEDGCLSVPFGNMTVQPLDWMVPAAGQGVLAIDACDPSVISKLSVINDDKCFEYRMAERLVLQKLDANCHTSIGLHAGESGVKWFYKNWVGFEPWGESWLEKVLKNMNQDA